MFFTGNDLLVEIVNQLELQPLFARNLPDLHDLQRRRNYSLFGQERLYYKRDGDFLGYYL
jgi:hypothetical protein